MTETPDFYGSGTMALPATDEQPRAAPQVGSDPYGSGQMSGASPPPDQGFLSKSWQSILDLPKTIARDLTPTVQIPGTAGPQLAPGLAASSAPAAPITEPQLFAGARRGVRDVLDTGAEGLAWGANKIPGVDVDVDALRAQNKAARDAWEQIHKGEGWADVGRVVGQTAATLPALGGVGGLISRGALALPGAVGRAAQFLSSAIPAASTTGRAGQLALQGASTGAAQAGLTASTSDQPLGQQVATGGLTGAALGPVLGGVTKAVDALRGYVGGVRPEIAALADTARQLTPPVNVPVSSLSTNPFMRTVADVGKTLPLSGADASALANQRALQGAVMRQMGSTADTFGDAEMRAARDNIRTGYRTALAQVPPITGGTPLATDLANIGTDATRFLDRDTAGHVGRAIQEAAGAWQGGPITADAYKALTASDGPLARVADAAPGAAQPYIASVRDAVRARMLAAAPPGVADDLRALDAQYRVMKTMQPLAELSTTGDISPGGILQRVRAQSSKYDSSNEGLAYTGGGTLGDIGRVGKQFFGHIPDTGTAPRMQTYEFAKHPISTTVAALPSVLGNRWLQQWLRSPTVSGRIIDTSLGAATPDISRTLPYGLLGPIDYQRDRQ